MRKIGPNGKVDTYKASLLAKRHSQKKSIDYGEAFPPVGMIKFIKILFAIAKYLDYEIWQIDVKAAFLNGYLKVEIYIEHHKSFMSEANSRQVCKLNRPIYELKQAFRSWSLRFCEAVKTFVA